MKNNNIWRIFCWHECCGKFWQFNPLGLNTLINHLYSKYKYKLVQLMKKNQEFKDTIYGLAKILDEDSWKKSRLHHEGRFLKSHLNKKKYRKYRLFPIFQVRLQNLASSFNDNISALNGINLESITIESSRFRSDQIWSNLIQTRPGY